MENSYNTDIDISSFKDADLSILNQLDDEFKASGYSEIPSEFNWAIRLSNDTPDVSKKKSLISSVKNQHMCGCCWAISCATAISDAYVVKGLVSWMPKVSHTYALSKYPQQKCMGGSARLLLEDIKKGGGITSEYCVDDSWCVNNKKCFSESAQNHFQNDTSNKKYLSSLIPSVGCYEDRANRHYVYTIADVYSMTVSETLKVLDTQNKIKQHIMVRGPVVAGFLIMENFLEGNFDVYFENGIYQPVKNIIYSFQKDKIVGSHSVVIVGWGVQKNTMFEGKLSNIPYWYCRNSWGVDWGDKGYFKIAMYPYNKVCQFSKRIRVLHNNKVKEVGGVTGFNVTDMPKLEFIKSNNITSARYATSEGGSLYNLRNILDPSKKNHEAILLVAAVLAVFIFIKGNNNSS